MKPMHQITAQDVDDLLNAANADPIRLSSCWGLRVRVETDEGGEEDQFFTFNELADAQFFVVKLCGMEN